MKLKDLINDSTLSVDTKLQALAKSIQHLQRQPASVATHTMPPVPISQVALMPEEDGTVMRFMFPAAGVIKKAALFIEVMPVDEKGKSVSMVEVDALFFNSAGSTRQTFDVYRKPLVMDLDVVVSAGDRLQVRLPAGQDASGIWCAFLYEISMSQAKITQVLLEELRSLQEEADAADEVSG